MCFFRISDAAHSRFWCRDPKRCLMGFLKMLILALPQIYTRVFYLWNSLDLDSTWVEDSRPCQFSYLPGVLARLAMRHTRVFGFGIQNNSYWAFLR